MRPEDRLRIITDGIVYRVQELVEFRFLWWQWQRWFTIRSPRWGNRNNSRNHDSCWWATERLEERLSELKKGSAKHKWQIVTEEIDEEENRTWAKQDIPKKAGRP